ncbi:arginine--tRNA ligase [Candidatus Saganbacteria bacterium]|nr:arginine--tRNA ligase [Candidatus Saganbacteria bacterium]
MREKLAKLVKDSASKLVSPSLLPEVDISIPQERYGDFATNIVLKLAPIVNKPIFEIASFIAADLSTNNTFEKVEAARNGFINFKLNIKFLQDILFEIIDKDHQYGRSNFGQNQKVLVEFVSANPTGPLHVGHGRWAVIGDDIASLLEAIGYTVEREFYVNDVGNQIDKLELSVKARINGTEIPEGGYGGDYVNRILEDPAIASASAGKQDIRRIILKIMLNEQKASLEKLGVKFDRFFSEETLHKNNKVKDAILKLKMHGVTFEEEGALWFKSQELGDDKNRVLIRANGETTYFAADIAYHADKYERGFDYMIDVWGADHHGYIPRLKAAIQSLGLQVSKFEVIIGQLVSLFRGKEPVRMSKRTGDMVTLNEVVDEVGRDATRFFMTMTSVNSHLNFDLELAKAQASDNPVYYVQYAHARISSIIKEFNDKKTFYECAPNLSKLTHGSERKLMRKLLDYPDEILAAAKRREPHILIEYSKNLAQNFHNFYHQCRVITEDRKLSYSRLTLVSATRIVLRNVLELLKVSAPERM